MTYESLHQRLARLEAEDAARMAATEPPVPGPILPPDHMREVVDTLIQGGYFARQLPPDHQMYGLQQALVAAGEIPPPQPGPDTADDDPLDPTRGGLPDGLE